LKEEALDRTMWRACFGRGFGPVVRQTTKWMNVWKARNHYQDYVSLLDNCWINVWDVNHDFWHYAITGHENKTVTTQNEIHLWTEIKILFAVYVTYKFGFGNFPCHRIPTHKHKKRDVSNDGSGSSFTLYLGKIYNTSNVCSIIHS